jgi:2-oxoglutarate dehydrogenase complex dehydrogenase (E1) component-like enzyme
MKFLWFNKVGSAGVRHIVLAMPHRGRLNLLTGLLQMSPASLFHKIKGGYEFPEGLGAAGDVISHLGTISLCCPKSAKSFLSQSPHQP